MTFAENLETTMKKLLDGVHKDGYNDGFAAGKAEGGGGESVDGAEVLLYATEVNQLFYRAQFPTTCEELTLDMPNISANLNSMFRMATGIKKLTLIVPTEQVYNAGYFFYISTVDASTIEEINIPHGIIPDGNIPYGMKFSDFSNFARYCGKLTKIGGSIDLSEATSTSNCFTRCYELQDVEFVPNTIKISISFADCKSLSDDSIASIVNGLATVETTQTLTVHADVAGRMSEAQKATITTKKWELAY